MTRNQRASMIESMKDAALHIARDHNEEPGDVDGAAQYWAMLSDGELQREYDKLFAKELQA